MKKDNRTCICCGTAYKYCNTCAEYAHLPQWKNIYDKVECKVIFDVATDFCAKLITKEEAKEKLGEYDIKNIQMKESLAKIINEILGSKVVKAIPEKVEEKVESKEEKVEEAKEETSKEKNEKKK